MQSFRILLRIIDEVLIGVNATHLIRKELDQLPRPDSSTLSFVGQDHMRAPQILDQVVWGVKEGLAAGRMRALCDFRCVLRGGLGFRSDLRLIGSLCHGPTVQARHTT